MTDLVAIDLVLALVAAAATGGLYAAWPRRMSLEEWVVRRRRVATTASSATWAGPLAVVQKRAAAAARLAGLSSSVDADLRLLRFRELGSAKSAEELYADLLRVGGMGAGVGLVASLGLWLLAGAAGMPAIVPLFTSCGGTLLPALRWARFRRRAGSVRASMERRLPRLLTGARVLLESGAITPRQALMLATSVYRDAAADVLREALLDQEVRRVEIPDALENAGREYGLDRLEHLADAYRVSARQGTEVAELLVEFAQRLRHEEHALYRERMTRAPVVMTVPALVFFVMPILALVLLLVLTPLAGAFGEL